MRRRAIAMFGVLTLVSTACSGVDDSYLNATDLTVGTRPIDTGQVTAADNTGTTIVTGAGDGETGSERTVSTSTPNVEPAEPLDGSIERLEPLIISSAPHDPTAFTQGLELYDGVLIESTGLYGSSSRRRLIPTSGDIEREVELSPELFANGLTVYQDTLFQITWREGVAVVADPTTLTELDRFTFDGEGWGICALGDELAMTNGSSQITFREPMSFTEIRSVEVTIDGSPVENLNELECVEGSVWANVWLTNDILEIDPASGEVTAVVNADALAPADAEAEEVLSGIAYNPAAETFYLTGKRWDTIYEVQLVPAG